MPLLGRSVTRLEDSPPRPVQLNDTDGNPIAGVFAHIRLLPKSLAEQLIRPAMRKVRGKDEDQAEEAIGRWMREHMAKALSDTSGGFEWGFDDEGAVKLYEEFFPGLKVGESVCFDGKWSDGLKARFFADQPAVLSLFIDAYRRLSAVGEKEKREDFEGKGAISATSSSSA